MYLKNSLSLDVDGLQMGRITVEQITLELGSAEISNPPGDSSGGRLLTSIILALTLAEEVLLLRGN